MGFTIGYSGTALDTRATQVTGYGMTFGDFWGVDASVANGAQPVASFYDREGVTALRVLRGTSGSTNLAVGTVSANIGHATADTNGTTWSVAAAVVV